MVEDSRSEITKSETGQMNNHCAWFEQEYNTDKVKRILIIPTTTVSAHSYSRRAAFINATTNNNSLGGSIDITAQTLDLSSGGKIAAATSGRGDAGNIDLNVSDRIEIDNSVESSARFVEFDSNSQLLNDLQAEGSGIFANATETATGNAGNITIGSLPNQSPEELIISNDAQIVVNSQGTRSGGSIFIRSENIELNNNASISASTEAIRGGEITLNIADNLVLENNSSISAEAGSNADGGNINIDTNFIVAFPNQNNDIIADAQRGNGGNINITAEAVFNIEERPLNDFTNDINASSALGAQFDGNVAITIPDINAIQTETQVPNNLIESQQTTEQACQSNRINAAKNGLNILGKGGIPPQPIEPLQADNIIIDQKFAANYIPPEIEPIETSQGDIYPARGIIKTADGGIILTAYPTENIPTRTPIIKPNCH
jgi:large exoprotein involved in heme utilization and adhesion